MDIVKIYEQKLSKYILSPKLTRIKYRVKSFFEKNQAFPDGQRDLDCLII